MVAPLLDAYKVGGSVESVNLNKRKMEPRVESRGTEM